MIFLTISKKLERIRIMNIKLDVPRGKWRKFSNNEINELKVNLIMIRILSTLILTLYTSICFSQNIKTIDTINLDEVAVKILREP